MYATDSLPPSPPLVATIDAELRAQRQTDLRTWASARATTYDHVVALLKHGVADPHGLLDALASDLGVSPACLR